MSNVVGLNGTTPLQAAKPSQYLVDYLREKLTEAESGQLQGMAAACLYHDAGAGWQVTGRVGGLHMIGALEMCKAELAKINMGDDA